MTFQTIVETMAGHDLNHLGQLHKLVQGQRQGRRNCCGRRLCLR